MRKAILCTVLFAALSGCSAGALLFSESARQELVANFDGAVDSQQLLNEFMYSAARGEVPLDTLAYDAPSAQNGFVGTITGTGAAFPFGVGDLTLTFTVAGDQTALDPYAPGIDLSSFNQIVIDAVATFNGLAVGGASLSALADITITTLNNGPDSASTLIDGTYSVDHNGYDLDLVSQDFAATFDHVTQQLTSVGGVISGTMDIPDFAPDVDVTMTGIGSAVQVGIDVLADTITYTLDLL